MIAAATKSFGASGGTFDRILLIPITNSVLKRSREHAKKAKKKTTKKKAAKKAR